MRVKKELLQKSPNTKSLKQEIKQLSSKFIKLGEEIDAKFERIEFKMEHFNNRFQFYEKFSTFYREIKKDEVKRSEYARKFMLAASMIPKDHAFAKVFEELCERHL